MKPPRENARPAVFFDRDGVVNRSPGPGYVLSWEEFTFSPGIFDLLRFVHQRRHLAILVTSQKCVGKGLLSAAALDRIHERMQTLLCEKAGAPFHAIYTHTGAPDCPHPPKPDPGMLQSAARDHRIDLARSWLIGDADRDIAMAVAAALRGTIRVRGDQPIGEPPATATVDDLAQARAILQRALPRPS